MKKWFRIVYRFWQNSPYEDATDQEYVVDATSVVDAINQLIDKCMSEDGYFFRVSSCTELDEREVLGSNPNGVAEWEEGFVERKEAVPV